MSAVAARVVLGLLVAATSGCGRDVVALDQISGTDVATMAERELEAENPQMVPGTLTCPDLELRAGASVRCMRTATLDGGRWVKVRGVITVTSLASGGRLHVRMDDDATEFGVTAEHLASEVGRRAGVRPTRVRCPDLRGSVGEVVTCQVRAGGRQQEVDVVVTQVDPEDYRTTYVTRAPRG